MRPGCAVKVRSAGDRQAEVLRHRAVARFRRRVVIAVAGFERVQARARELGDALVDARQPRMRERGNPPGTGNHLDHVPDRRAAPRHERRTPFGEQPVECIPAVRGMTRGHEGIGDVGASHAPGEISTRRPQHRLERHGIPERAQPIADVADAPETIRTLSGQELAESSIRGVDEVAEHVQLGRVVRRRQLDPGNAVHHALRRALRDFQARGRVVIRERDHIQTRGPRRPHQRARRQAAVGCCRMEVQIDAHAGSRCA